jgi:hypothetical protein
MPEVICKLSVFALYLLFTFTLNPQQIVTLGVKFGTSSLCFFDALYFVPQVIFVLKITLSYK